MTLVKIPLPLRIVAYILGIIVGGLGGPVVVYLLAIGRIDSDLATLVTAVIALVVALAGTIALSHLSLPDAVPEATLGTIDYVAPVDTSAPAATTGGDPA